MIAVAGVAALGTQGHGPEYATITLPFSSNPWTTKLNVSISRVAYITQPSEWNYSVGGKTLPKYTDSTAWVTNNSGYQFVAWNSTTSSAPNPALLNFSVGSSLGSTISYIFTDSRVAVNGTGTTLYMEISQSGQTAVPAGSTNNALSSAANYKQNIVVFQLTEHNNTSYTPSFSYYAWNSKTYQNYTTYTFTANVTSLDFYDFMVNMQPTGTVASVMNGTGSIVARSPTLYPVLDGNLSKVGFLTYITSAAASTAGDMSILNYAYLVDNSPITYAPSVQVAGAASSFSTEVAPFDPGATSSNYTQASNSSSAYSSTTMNSDDFQSVVNSSSNATQTSSRINTNLLPSRNQTQVLSTQALTQLRASTGLPGQVTTNLYVNTWTQKGINASIVSFLKSYVGSKIGVPAGDVTIVSYLVDAEAFDLKFSPATMTQVGDYIYNSVPGILQKDHLSLVNTQTNAVVAGASIGMFWTASGAVAPAIAGQFVENPATGVWYDSVAAAGFPGGSYIAGASIVVPGQATFYGFAADGLPIFASTFNPFGLGGAATAVRNFFTSGASAISNAVTQATTTASSSLYAIKASAAATVGTDISQFSNDTAQAVNSVMPFLGGVSSNIGTAVSGTITHTLGGVASGLASFKSSAAGDIAAGVSNVQQGIYSLGADTSRLGASFQHAAYNTLGTLTKDSSAVLSPIVTTVKNLPGQIKNDSLSVFKSTVAVGASLYSAASKLGSTIQTEGQAALNTIGNTFSRLSNSTASWGLNAFGNMLASLNPLNLIGGMMNSTVHILEIAAIGIGIIVLILIGIFLFRRHEKKPKSRSRA